MPVKNLPVKNFIVAIELGSTKIRGIAGQKKSDGSFAVYAVISEDATQCIRKGVVYNIDKTVQCISSIIQRLRGILRAGIKHVYVGVGGQSIHSERNTIIHDMLDGMPVTQKVIVEMMDQNRGTLYPKMEILDVEVQEYRVDSLLQSEPVGIQCQRLEGNFLNILQSKRHYQNLNTCFEKAGVKLAEIYLAPFALADAVLTSNEKRSGTILVDLGADTTTVMVYYKNIVRHIAVIPLGAANITKDITSLQVEEQDAEVIKLRYASAYTRQEEIDSTLKYDLDSERKVESAKFIDIVEARVQEIIQNVWNQVPTEYAEKMIGGIVLTGGGSNLRNIDVAFREYTSIHNVRIAKFVSYTINSSNPDINAHDGKMNTIIGLMAKGDQNCYTPNDDTKVQDMFNENTPTTQTEETAGTTTTRDPHSLPPGVVPTREEMEKLEQTRKNNEGEKAAGTNDGNGNDTGNTSTPTEEKPERPKKPGVASRIMKWFAGLASDDE